LHKRGGRWKGFSLGCLQVDQWHIARAIANHAIKFTTNYKVTVPVFYVSWFFRCPAFAGVSLRQSLHCIQCSQVRTAVETPAL